jgi:hypothetical protein
MCFNLFQPQVGTTLWVGFNFYRSMWSDVCQVHVATYLSSLCRLPISAKQQKTNHRWKLQTLYPFEAVDFCPLGFGFFSSRCSNGYKLRIDLCNNGIESTKNILHCVIPGGESERIAYVTCYDMTSTKNTRRLHVGKECNTKMNKTDQLDELVRDYANLRRHTHECVIHCISTRVLTSLHVCMLYEVKRGGWEGGREGRKEGGEGRRRG